MSGSATVGRRTARSDGKGRAVSRTTSQGRTLRLTARGLEAIALFVILALLIAGIMATSGRGAEPLALSRQLKVQSGDTLWTLASQHPVEGMTTAQVADLIAESNGLSTRLVLPGQVILVPGGAPDQRLASR